VTRRARAPRAPSGAAALLAGFLLAAACAAPREEAPPAGDVPPPTVAESEAAADTIRVRGTLQSSDLGVRMVGQGATEGLQIDVTTLSEPAIQVAADDVRTYFQDLKKRIPDAVPAAQASTLQPFLVGFTGLEKEISFDPTRLELRVEGATHYPRYIVPVSPTFERRVVDLYQTVYALYLFPADIDLTATLEFRYGEEMSSGGAWRTVVDRIQRAKARLEGG
jgi:hypothetical protein